ncbi:putative F420-0 ABC transporter substrate-binding protein [Cellulomonas composti]|uniref:ABC transporter substrate-binding protein n=1 Tax=Cellulomonas composti TaxID=266130 RepID=A0A511J8T7_9CELL|nr:putative F420-0 ABC transporter substrate-binding protein [Cellulomonas composti]GEL94401.1 ABC transporter substrate-binding protein [Cellulomonas composti]
MTLSSHPRRALLGAPLIVGPLLVGPLLVALAGCAGTAEPASSSPTATSSQAAPSAVTVDNCGTSVTVESAPQRVVTIKSSTTEMMLALGLADRLVGTAFSDGPVPDEYAAAAADVPVLSDKVPGQEALLEVEPDFVYGGWESNFSADGVGERASLAALGIGTYVSPSACKEPGYMPDPLTFDDVYDEVLEAGDVFGAPAVARDVVADMQATLATAQRPSDEVSALWWSSGTDTPYVGAGIGAPQMLMDAAGLTNVVADVHDTWTSVGWEQVVAADPDVIVLVDSSWNTAEHKKESLASNPATAALTAVREGRYLVVPFAASEAGVRNADAVVSLDEQLAELGLG